MRRPAGGGQGCGSAGMCVGGGGQAAGGTDGKHACALGSAALLAALHADEQQAQLWTRTTPHAFPGPVTHHDCFCRKKRHMYIDCPLLKAQSSPSNRCNCKRGVKAYAHRALPAPRCPWDAPGSCRGWWPPPGCRWPGRDTAQTRPRRPWLPAAGRGRGGGALRFEATQHCNTLLHERRPPGLPAGGGQEGRGLVRMVTQCCNARRGKSILVFGCESSLSTTVAPARPSAWPPCTPRLALRPDRIAARHCRCLRAAAAAAAAGLLQVQAALVDEGRRLQAQHCFVYAQRLHGRQATRERAGRLGGACAERRCVHTVACWPTCCCSPRTPTPCLGPLRNNCIPRQPTHPKALRVNNSPTTTSA